MTVEPAHTEIDPYAEIDWRAYADDYRRRPAKADLFPRDTGKRRR